MAKAEKSRKVGSKRQLSNGTWELSVSMGSDLKGNRNREYDYAQAVDEKEADILLDEFVVKCKKGNYSDGDRMLIKDYAPMWEQDYAEELRKRTKSGYNDKIERIVEFLGRYQLRELVKKPILIKKFYQELQKDGVRKDGKPGGLSILTIRHHHEVLSSMLGTAVDWNLIKENPCARVKPPKVGRLEKKKKRKKNVLTIEQAKLFLQALYNLPSRWLKYVVIVFLAIFTGYRREEILGLEWPDFVLSKNQVTVERTSSYTVEDGIYEDDTKTEESERTAVFPVIVTDIIKKYKVQWEANREKVGDKWHDTQRLFVQWNGLPMHPDTISSWFPKFIRKNNLPYVTLHGLRHTYGSILLAMGMDLESVADLMGHEDIQMLVQKYGHNVKKQVNEEAAVLMDKALLQDKRPTEEAKAEKMQLPEYIPEDVKMLIKKLISNYVPK